MVTVQNHSWQREVVLQNASVVGAPQISASNDYRPFPVVLPAQENWIGRLLIGRVPSALGANAPCVIAALSHGEQASGCLEGAVGSPAHHRS